ncbi:hypothetical protein CAEBREN_13335 [Caenorhabditis brenneri]|uniref:G-protein coupled receptors family 1 profile domain-containing protein n=1 Tax=Caenorhabditis brenneri TaxID=135651 RepID=G0M9R3_CAEBE|nr:hypothetical protein CAEBREN_13335 [Caenorhabditis brenneri]
MNQTLTLETSNFFDSFKIYMDSLQFLSAIFAVFLNIPHLTICLQKSMRTSNTNSLIIGISISDLLYSLEIVITKTTDYLWFYDVLCESLFSYFNQLSEIIMDFLSKTSVKSSFWTGASLAFLRVLALKSWGNSEFLGQQWIGYLISLIIFAISAIVPGQLLLNERVESVSGELLCFDDSGKNSELFLVVFEDVDSLFKVNNASAGVSDIIVAILYPILAFFIYFEIRKSAEKLKTISKPTAIERYKRAKLILFLTLSYVICTLPQGVLQLMFYFIHFENNSFLSNILGNGEVIVSILFCWNAIAQCFICYLLSSNYRSTAKKVFGCRKIAPKTSIEFVTVHRL